MITDFSMSFSDPRVRMLGQSLTPVQASATSSRFELSWQSLRLTSSMRSDQTTKLNTCRIGPPRRA
jgi:hypothetical protein